MKKFSEIINYFPGNNILPQSCNAVKIEKGMQLKTGKNCALYDAGLDKFN